MMRMATGFWVSQIVGVVARLHIADHLARGPATAADLARTTGGDPAALFRVLRAAATVGVLTADGDRFSLTPLGETLRAGGPRSMREMAIMQTAPAHWLPWGRLTDAVRTGKSQSTEVLGCTLFEHYARHPEEAEAFSGAMGNLSATVAPDVAALIDTASVACAVDVGGAEGTLMAALLQKNPSLRGIVFDLPHVCPATKAKLEALGLASRCETLAGDFFSSLPAADLYLLKQILHDWSDEESVAILRNCTRAMTPRGRVVLVEMVIPDDGAPTLAQLMDVNMLALLTRRERTRAEYAALFGRAGLRLTSLVNTRSPFQILEATRA